MNGKELKWKGVKEEPRKEDDSTSGCSDCVQVPKVTNETVTSVPKLWQLVEFFGEGLYLILKLCGGKGVICAQMILRLLTYLEQYIS
jgi:hypothetical protein